MVDGCQVLPPMCTPAGSSLFPVHRLLEWAFAQLFPNLLQALGSPISSPDQRLSLPDLGRYQDRLNRRHGGKEKTQKDDLIMSDPAVLPPIPKNRLGQTEKKVGVIDRPRLINHN